MIVVRGHRLEAFGQVSPCSLGRGGLTDDKREGDGATPLGRYLITGCYYRADRLACPAPWATPIGPRDLWSDDPSDPAYNRLVRAPHGFSHERLRRGDRLYDLVLTIDHNATPAIPGQGSAIFLHQWRRPGFPTAGCVAMPTAVLRWLAARAYPGTPVDIGR